MENSLAAGKQAGTCNPVMGSGKDSKADELAKYFMPNFADILSSISIVCSRMYSTKTDESTLTDCRFKLFSLIKRIDSFYELDIKKSSKFNQYPAVKNLESLVWIRETIPQLSHKLAHYMKIKNNEFVEKEEYFENEIFPAIKKLKDYDMDFKNTLRAYCKREGKNFDDYIFKKK
ncbi:MAG: hypothetical protein PHC66_02205 [Candidatus Nanoarchaeia archaeon]|nr:hypothetical protein [Candidatus Nanoarchaeia archaeon]MDD5239715.1 hypothetical protein [Candidatus Nanoarchaeia archaeon]